MPSPICLANGELITSAINYDMTSAVTLSLQDRTGVNSWKVEVIGTDGTITVDQANQSLFYNKLYKLYTYTFGRNANAIAFKSTINNGIDTQGNYQDSYSTTFELHVPNQTNGLRLIPAGSNDWLASINEAIVIGL